MALFLYSTAFFDQQVAILAGAWGTITGTKSLAEASWLFRGVCVSLEEESSEENL